MNCPGGGNVVSGDHNLKSNVSVANILALYETAREFRGEGCTL
jgi:hypothetical protein